MTHIVVVTDSTHRAMTNRKYITENTNKSVQEYATNCHSCYKF